MDSLKIINALNDTRAKLREWAATAVKGGPVGLVLVISMRLREGDIRRAHDAIEDEDRAHEAWLKKIGPNRPEATADAVELHSAHMKYLRARLLRANHRYETARSLAVQYMNSIDVERVMQKRAGGAL